MYLHNSIRTDQANGFVFEGFDSMSWIYCRHERRCCALLYRMKEEGERLHDVWLRFFSSCLFLGLAIRIFSSMMACVIYMILRTWNTRVAEKYQNMFLCLGDSLKMSYYGKKIFQFGIINEFIKCWRENSETCTIRSIAPTTEIGNIIFRKHFGSCIISRLQHSTLTSTLLNHPFVTSHVSEGCGHVCVWVWGVTRRRSAFCFLFYTLGFSNGQKEKKQWKEHFHLSCARWAAQNQEDSPYTRWTNVYWGTTGITGMARTGWDANIWTNFGTISCTS